MQYRFGSFTLDTETFELKQHGEAIHAEPLVFDLLCCLLTHAGQVLSRDQLIEHVWDGRIVSDATVSSAIKAARRALGDTGEHQVFIRTVRGRGFKFVADVEHIKHTSPVEPISPVQTLPQGADDEDFALTTHAVQPRQPLTHNASASAAFQRHTEATLPLGKPAHDKSSSAPLRIAVLPLHPLSNEPSLQVFGDAISQEIILEISRLRWLSVIARGSSFQIRGQEIDFVAARQQLTADYFVTGNIFGDESDCTLTIELSHAESGNVLWADALSAKRAELMHLRASLASQIVATLEPRIQAHEALSSGHVPTEQLDAWAAYHRGLWNMYNLSERRSEEAAKLFAHAISLDPGFARAHAGLSFTYFHRALVREGGQLSEQVVETRKHAERAMELDPLDPFVNLSFGRAKWISGDLEGGLAWMDRASAISPNYVFALYNRALIGTLLGDGESNEDRIVQAIELSPIDPMNYAMLATRALTYVVRDDFETARDWANRAVRAPHAHVQIFVICAFANELCGHRARAQDCVADLRRRHPNFKRSDFLNSFPLPDGSIITRVEMSLRRLGL